MFLNPEYNRLLYLEPAGILTALLGLADHVRQIIKERDQFHAETWDAERTNYILRKELELPKTLRNDRPSANRKGKKKDKAKK